LSVKGRCDILNLPTCVTPGDTCLIARLQVEYEKSLDTPLAHKTQLACTNRLYRLTEGKIAVVEGGA
jgi:hypothetical protein